MTIQEAIQHAIEGGYDKTRTQSWEMSDRQKYEIVIRFNKALLDPEFWKSLGKSLGWKKEDKGAGTDHENWVEGYISKWHDLVDHLIDGGTIEDYFKESITR